MITMFIFFLLLPHSDQSSLLCLLAEFSSTTDKSSTMSERICLNILLYLIHNTLMEQTKKKIKPACLLIAFFVCWKYRCWYSVSANTQILVSVSVSLKKPLRDMISTFSAEESSGPLDACLSSDTKTSVPAFLEACRPKEGSEERENKPTGRG